MLGTKRVVWAMRRPWRWGLGAALLVLFALWRPLAVPVVRLGGAPVVLPREPAAAERALAAGTSALLARPLELATGEQHWTTSLAALGVGPAPGFALPSSGRRRPFWRAPAPVEVPFTVDPDRLAAALAALRPRPELPPLPAHFRVAGAATGTQPDDPEVGIDPGRPGWVADRPALAGRLLAAVQSGAGRVALPLLAVPPSPAAADLVTMGVRRRIALFRSDFDPRIPRAENVARATAALDGLLLAPGELLSVLQLVGPVDPAHGWQDAWVIQDGRLVPGVGGGVCQVASTLYGAALRAGLEVVERHPHSLAVTYLPPSQDAAIAPGAEDLRLRNNTGHYILLRAAAAGGRVSIAVYGDAPDGQRIEVQSEVLATYPPPVQYVPDASLPPGATVVLAAGSPGHRSVAWRLVYQGDRLLRREQISLDSYPAEPRRLARGSASFG